MSGLPVPPEGDPPVGGADGQTRGPDQRLGRARRLTRSTLFDEAYAQQNKRVGRLMVMWLRSGEGATLRLGVVASRKVGNSVQRAKARRRLRDVYRRHRHALRGGVDVVLVARASLLPAERPAIDRDFLALAGQAGLLTTP